MPHCPDCGTEYRKGQRFCSGCGRSLLAKPERVGRSGFLTAGGILTIIAACICIIVGIGGVGMFAAGETHYHHYEYYYTTHPAEYLLAGIFGLLGFAFGLTAGILALKRTRYPLTVIGVALIIIGGILTAALGAEAFIVMGIPILILGILSMVFVGITKREFA